MVIFWQVFVWGESFKVVVEEGFDEGLKVFWGIFFGGALLQDFYESFCFFGIFSAEGEVEGGVGVSGF